MVMISDEAAATLKTLSVLARKFGVPSLLVEHGCGLDYGYVGFYNPVSDKTTVWGNYMRDMLVRKGHSETDIVVTGAPKLDVYFEKNPPHEMNMAKTILLATDDVPIDLIEQVCLAAMGYVERRVDARLVVKPKGTLSELLVIRKLAKNDRITIIGSGEVIGSNKEFLRDATVVVTQSLGFAVESLISEKPTVIANFGIDPMPEPAASGAAIGVRDENELSSALNSVLDDSCFRDALLARARSLLPSYYAIRDSGAARRIAKLIVEMINSKEQHDQ
jgi:UDP-N-acetylglucosamine 2-epimerase